MSFSRVLGQEPALSRLRPLLASRRLPPALLFHGPDGVGKSLAAAETAKALNCVSDRETDACGLCGSCAAFDKGADMDFKRLDLAYQAGLLGEEENKQQRVKVESVRHLIRDLELRSILGRWKIAVIPDAERLQPAASSALLKALEEPPPRTLWILTTSKRERLPGTVLSRCRPVRFRALPAAVVESILAAQGTPAEQARRLAGTCEGSPGLAARMRERPQKDPSSWLADPLGPFRLAEELPKETAQARISAEHALRAIAWHARDAGGTESYADPGFRAFMARLESLSSALKANADPRLVVELAALELQRRA